MSNNGKNGQGPTPQPPSMNLDPENIAHQCQVVITKDGHSAIIGDLDNLPLLLHLVIHGY